MSAAKAGSSIMKHAIGANGGLVPCLRAENSGMVRELEARLGSLPEGWGTDFSLSAANARRKEKPSIKA